MPENTELTTKPATVEQASVKVVEKAIDGENGAAAVGPTEETANAEETCPSYELSKFKLTRILQHNTLRKTITLLGKFPDVSVADLAVVLLEKQAFKECDVQTASDEVKDSAPRIFSEALQVHTDFINNIYGSFQCIPSTEFNGIKTTVIYPATEKHIEKYSITQKYLITETSALYEQLTLPYINSSQLSLDWVYNILEHRQETDRIVYEDSNSETGFILLPDLKWDGKNLETLYLLAIVHKRDIKSLRDLNDTHLPLLRNLRDGIAEAIEKRYGLCASQLRMYLHYQPSFYHLHIHINPVRSDAPGIWCEKSHMLDTVISNIELMSDYYKRVTLPFVLFEGSKLLDEYEKQGLQKRAKVMAEKNDGNNEQIQTDAVDEPQSKRVKLEQPITETKEPTKIKIKGVAEIENPGKVIEAAAE